MTSAPPRPSSEEEFFGGQSSFAQTRAEEEAPASVDSDERPVTTPMGPITMHTFREQFAGMNIRARSPPTVAPPRVARRDMVTPLQNLLTTRVTVETPNVPRVLRLPLVQGSAEVPEVGDLRPPPQSLYVTQPAEPGAENRSLPQTSGDAPREPRGSGETVTNPPRDSEPPPPAERVPPLPEDNRYPQWLPPYFASGYPHLGFPGFPPPPPANPSDSPGDPANRPPYYVPYYVPYPLQSSSEERSRAPKIRAPDLYDGQNDPDGTRLRVFVSQCIQSFLNDPGAFSSDRAKVNFASSYLSGQARSWWVPYTASSPPHAILEDWSMFVEELNNLCGDPDIQNTAQNRIAALRMPERDRLRRWLIEFYEWYPHTGYNSVAGTKAFYNMLPKRITDTFQIFGRPSDLQTMVQRAQIADANYWREIDNSRTPNAPGRRSATTNTPSSNSGTGSSNTPSGGVAATSTRLTDAERKRRMENHLCLYCGEAGHIRANCPKRPPTSTTTTTSTSTPPANSTTNPPRTGRVAFTMTSTGPSASIEEEVEASGSD